MTVASCRWIHPAEEGVEGLELSHMNILTSVVTGRGFAANSRLDMQLDCMSDSLVSCRMTAGCSWKYYTEQGSAVVVVQIFLGCTASWPSIGMDRLCGYILRSYAYTRASSQERCPVAAY